MTKRQLAARASAAVLIVMVAGACSTDPGDTVGELADAMAEAYNTKDTDAMVDLTCEADKSRYATIDLHKEMQARTFGVPYTVSVAKVEENGDHGTVTLEFFSNNKHLPEEFEVSKIDGKWLVCNR
ncbi:hypothetical protein ACFVMC_07415 [Nocardia sp. NPDC127579]|uniref:Rv0361 family membrane protein n=1 Tax=Nocardia sp. NPDC127579 TaxID=3345402 RepID=UPI003638422A